MIFLWYWVLEFIVIDGLVIGVCGIIFVFIGVWCGEVMIWQSIGEFEIIVVVIVVVFGGIGGNYDFVCVVWLLCFGILFVYMFMGVFVYVDGLMQVVSEVVGVCLINGDWMWYYVEGIMNWDFVWFLYGICIFLGLFFFWFDVIGKCFLVLLFFGFDIFGIFVYLCMIGYDYFWFVMLCQIVEKEFVFLGSEQNFDLMGKDVVLLF